MSYDSTERPVFPRLPSADPKDLEAIVMLLELAAVYLTSGPESTFTASELINQAHAIGGDDLRVEEADMKIVLGNAGFLKKWPEGRLGLK